MEAVPPAGELRIAPLPTEQWTVDHLQAFAPRDGSKASPEDVIGQATKLSADLDDWLLALARHPGVVDTWRSFGYQLARRGVLPTADRELAILRVAWLLDCPGEWYEHLELARAAGMTAKECVAVEHGPTAPVWSDRQRAVLNAVGDLSRDHWVSDATWRALAVHYGPQELIELVFLIGHYQMLAGVIKSMFQVPPSIVRQHTSEVEKGV